MRRMDISVNMVEIYERNYEEVELFKIKPWDLVQGVEVRLRDDSVLSYLATQYGMCGMDYKKELYEELGETPFIITKEMIEKAERHKRVLCDIDGYNISLWMLELNVGERMISNIEPPKRYSIRERAKDDSIIAEMKSKVDRKRLQQMLSIGASTYDSKHFVKDSIVDMYLDLWANAKYEMYLMFGRNLSITTEYEKQIDEQEMRSLVNDLKTTYPKYAHWIERFENIEYIDNKVHYLGSSITNYVDYCVKGMKLSGFFTKLCADPQFDIDLSKVMQNKFVKGYMTISIDPYDYLTSSVNKNDWRSCHRITDGEYATGSFSYLLDDTTMIAYKHNGRDYDYTFYGFKFSGNSKAFRQCVYFDKDSCNIIFGRNYPNASEDAEVKMRELLEHQVCKYLGLPEDSMWKKSRNSYEGDYEDVSDLHYSDVEHGWNYTFVRLTKSIRDVANFKVGYNAPCLMCADDVEDEGYACVCRDCND